MQLRQINRETHHIDVNPTGYSWTYYSIIFMINSDEKNITVCYHPRLDFTVAFGSAFSLILMSQHFEYLD